MWVLAPRLTCCCLTSAGILDDELAAFVEQNWVGGRKAEERNVVHMSYLRDTFAAVADVSGHMNKDQLRDALQRAGLNPTLSQVEKVWGVMDRDRCGKVQLRDFARGCGQILVAHAFHVSDYSQKHDQIELADLKEIYGGEVPCWWTAQDGMSARSVLPSLDSLQRRLSFQQTRLADASLLLRLMASRMAVMQETNEALRLEVDALRPYQEEAMQLKMDLELASKRASESERALQDALQENCVARRMIEHLGGSPSDPTPLKSAFSAEQERLLQELQAQVRELSVPDERYCRLEERVQEMTKSKAVLEGKVEASEALLQSVVQVNQYLVGRQEEHAKGAQAAAARLARLQVTRERPGGGVLVASKSCK